MKKLLFCMTAIATFLGALFLNYSKDESFSKLFHCVDVEALASEVNTYYIHDCMMGIPDDEKAIWTKTSCNEVDGQQPDEMNECEEVRTLVDKTTDMGKCYEIVWTETQWPEL